ncbi:MAG: hypothetical protein ACR2MO_15340 [Acidimicrobiales bacterium]
MAKKAAPVKKAARKRTAMSDEHKAALAEGRDQGRAVRRYLEALDQHRPKRGRKRTQESVERRLAAIEEGFDGADPLARLLLIQERIDLQAELVGMGGDGADISQLEEEFVAAAAGYGSRRGITYSAWRASGVAAGVLRRAGISRAQ